MTPQQFIDIANALVDLLIEECNIDIRQEILNDIRECHNLIANPTLPISSKLQDFIDELEW